MDSHLTGQIHISDDQPRVGKLKAYLQEKSVFDSLPYPIVRVDEYVAVKEYIAGNLVIEFYIERRTADRP